MQSDADTEKNRSMSEDSEDAPLFKSWSRLYAFVLTELVVLILLFHLLSSAYQ